MRDPDSAATAAIFDLDDTLVGASTGQLIVKYLNANGELGRLVPRRAVARIAAGTVLYRFGLLDATRWVQLTVASCRGVDVTAMWALIGRWFDEMVVDYIAPGAVERLEWHREQGHIPVICTASSQYSALPVARHLRIEDSLYTNWEDDGVVLTGKVTLPVALGAGKVFWLRRWAASRGVDLRSSYFYTDHSSDLPLLQAVGYPSAVNPNATLAAIARQRGWPQYKWY